MQRLAQQSVHIISAIIIFLFPAMASFSCASAQETGSYLYEDDAWYDVTEWFDGNDFNPTDEHWFRWDNETYEPTDAADSGDVDNDYYGYDETIERSDTEANGGWYYDYDQSGHYDFNDYDSDGLYEVSSHFYDYDLDGLYDAYTTYTDRDGDGLYESIRYISFTSDEFDESKAADAKKNSANDRNRFSKQYTVSGEIAKMKTLKNKESNRVVLNVVRDDKTFVVDMGPADRLGVDLAQGKQVTARGPVSKVGDKQVLLAKEVEYGGMSKMVDRSPRKIAGEIIATKKVNPQRTSDDQQRFLVKLKTDDGRQALVDLGIAKGLNRQPKAGQQLEARGVAVEINERPVLFASWASIDGDMLKLAR